MSEARDLVGYARNPPAVRWPGDARVAISIVVAYEEGSENLLQDSLGRREMLAEAQSPVPPDRRDLANESMFEYGSRVGVWRLLRVLQKHRVRATFAACALALERNPSVARTITEEGHDVIAHGYRWEEYYLQDEDSERKSIAAAWESIARSTGQEPTGWLNRYGPSINTRRLLIEHGKFTYDSNGYNDDLPYYANVDGKPWLVVPYGLVLNDMKYWRAPGYATGEDYFLAMKETFDYLYQEGAEAPKMMSIGLHCRIAGWPGRASGVERFLEYARANAHVWWAGRSDIAKHWLKMHPPDD